MNKLVFVSIIFLSASLFTGCGNDGQKDKISEKSGSASVSDSEKNGANSRLTRSQLLGKWCYAYSEAGYGEEKEREEENITYIFRKDGTLLYQNNPSTDIDKEGKYSLAKGELKIEPTLTFLPGKILSVSKDKFVLGSSTMQLTFTRGVCRE